MEEKINGPEDIAIESMQNSKKEFLKSKKGIRSCETLQKASWICNWGF